MKNIQCAVSRLTAFSVLLTFLLSTPVSATPIPPDPPAITEFKFDALYNPGKIQENILADIYGDSLIVGIVPYQLGEFNLKATFAASAEAVKVNGVDQQSTVTVNDFSSAVTYVITSGATTKSYKVKLVYTGLPLVYVYTQGAAPILNKEDYVSGTVRIYPNEDTTAVYSGEMGIRGRGNSTWTFPKKPYRIKLGTAASLLGIPSDKDWVLLANYADKSLMRNSLAYHLGAAMNFAYTPRTTHVDLVLNGVYQGNYLLGEHIKADKDRVNIKELDEDEADEAVINGGYFLELDEYRDGTWFELASGLPFVVKSPDDIPEVQLNYIKTYMQQTEDAIFSEEFADPDVGYAKFINPETFIEFYWVNELLKNIDARDVSSIFYYKDRDEKLNMGPLWDLDVAAGNASVLGGDDPTSFFVRDAKWFKRLFEDPAFRRAAEVRWATFRDKLLINLPEVIDGFADKLELSQQQNFYKWDILNQPIFPSTLVLGSYENEVNYLNNWLQTRIAWIDSQIIGAPRLHSPVANDTVASLNPSVKWFEANLAEGYDVQVSLMESFETLLVDRTAVSDTTYSITEQLTEQTKYYWRVRSVNTEEQSEWSELGSFTTPLISGLGDGVYGISVFPNPTSRELFIEIPSFALIENAELVDVLGRTAVTSTLLPGVTTKIDVSNLQRGMYIVILRGRIDRPVTSKIVLR